MQPFPSGRRFVLLALAAMAICLAVAPAASAGPAPANSANRMIMWTGCSDLAGMSDAQLDRWRARGAGGFVCMTQHLRGLGGRFAFTGDEGRSLAGEEWSLQRRLRDSRIGARLRARGMKAYLGVYLTGFWNHRTPLAEWFDDRAWSQTVLPRMSGLAGGARDLGFSGIAFDGELYRTDGGRLSATWEWRYPGVRHGERAVRAQARRRGREVMSALAGAFPGVEIVAYDVQLPGSWNEVVQREVNGQRDALRNRLDVNFWDGLSSVPGYGKIRLADATFYKEPHLGRWDTALRYHYSSLYATLSRRFSGWAHAASRVEVSPFAWIDPGPAATVWDDARPPGYVADQLAAFRKWGMGGEFAIYANRGLGGFNYGPYSGGMRAASRRGVVDSERPRLSFSPAALKRSRARLRRSGRAIRLRGDASDNLAVRFVSWRTNKGRTGVARLDWRPVAGNPRDGYRGRTTWTVRIAPKPGERRVVIRVEDIKGLAARRSFSLRPGAR